MRPAWNMKSSKAILQAKSIVFMLMFVLGLGCNMTTDNLRTRILYEETVSRFTISSDSDPVVIARKLYSGLNSLKIAGESVRCTLKEQSDQLLQCGISRKENNFVILFDRRDRVLSVLWVLPDSKSPEYGATLDYYKLLKREVFKKAVSELGPESVKET